MATIDLAQAVGVNKAAVQTSNLKVVYKIWAEVDLAAAATAKGSALAAGDLITAVRVPENHAVLGVFVKKTSAFVGTSADLTIDVGVDGGLDYVSAWDFDGAAVGSYADVAPTAGQNIVDESTTVQVELVTASGTIEGGKLEVHAVLVDLTHELRGAIAQPKS